MGFVGVVCKLYIPLSAFIEVIEWGRMF